MKTIVAPSLLAADPNNLIREVKLVEALGCEFLHFDVMDGSFVSNTSFSYEDFEAIRGEHDMVNDVHIMVSDPLTYGVNYAKLGANIVTFHYEALDSDEARQQVIRAIKGAGAKVGMSIKPYTDISVVFPFLKELYLVLVMSVEPGKGGQKFMPLALDKIKKLKDYIELNDLSTLIEVDGGINNITGKEAVLAGANILVAGSYLFNHDDIKERIASLRINL